MVVAGLGAGTTRLQIDMSMESFFLSDDPVLLLHERFKETFGSDENVYIVYEARDGDVLSPASLEAARGLQEELLRALAPDRSGAVDTLESPLHHIVDVTSLVNANYLERG